MVPSPQEMDAILKMEKFLEDSFMLALFKNSIKLGNIETIKAIGFSMLPLIQQNDMISVQRANTYSVGDIIVYEYKTQGLLVHRIIAIKEKELWCRGDNAVRIEKIGYADIIGKVVAIHHN